MSVSQPFCLSVCLSVQPSACLSVCLSTRLSVNPIGWCVCVCVYGRGSSQSFLSFVLKRLVQCVQREVGEGVVTLDTRSHIKRLRALSSGGGMGDTSDTLCIRHKVANMSTFADELRQLAEIVAPRNLFLVFDCAERIRFVDDSFFPSLLRLQEMVCGAFEFLAIAERERERQTERERERGERIPPVPGGSSWELCMLSGMILFRAGWQQCVRSADQ